MNCRKEVEKVYILEEEKDKKGYKIKGLLQINLKKRY